MGFDFNSTSNAPANRPNLEPRMQIGGGIPFEVEKPKTGNVCEDLFNKMFSKEKNISGAMPFNYALTSNMDAYNIRIGEVRSGNRITLSNSRTGGYSIRPLSPDQRLRVTNSLLADLYAIKNNCGNDPKRLAFVNGQIAEVEKERGKLLFQLHKVKSPVRATVKVINSRTVQSRSSNKRTPAQVKMDNEFRADIEKRQKDANFWRGLEGVTKPLTDPFNKFGVFVLENPLVLIGL